MIRISTKKGGYTLAELVVVIAMSVIIGLVITALGRDAYVLSGSAQSSVFAQYDASTLLQPTVGELRTASISNTGSYPLITVGTSTLSFYSDINGDGTKEEITYYLSGTTLYKTIIEPSGTPLQYTGSGTPVAVISNIANTTSTSTPIFQYYDGTYDGTTAPLSQPVNITSVRLVKMTVIINTFQNHIIVPMTATTQVSLRNLKNNL